MKFYYLRFKDLQKVPKLFRDGRTMYVSVHTSHNMKTTHVVKLDEEHIANCQYQVDAYLYNILDEDLSYLVLLGVELSKIRIVKNDEILEKVLLLGEAVHYWGTE